MNLMNKFLIASLLFLGAIFYADAQQDLTGRILDNARQPIPFATVVLLHPADSVMKFFGVTNDDGIYQIRRVKDGDYLMQFSFTGLKTVYRSIKVPLSAQNLGDLQMEENPRLLKPNSSQSNSKPIHWNMTPKPLKLVKEQLLKSF